MDATKFNEKALSNFPVAYFFSAVEAFGKRIGAAECALERFLRMREEYDRLFKAFDEAYKRTQKSELTAKIAALDKERDLVSDLQAMGLTELNRRLLSRTEQIEQLMGKRNEEKSDVVVGELKAAREKLDGHYREFVTFLNAVQELQPEESLSKAAQYYNADLAKNDLQYQQSRKKGGKDEPTPETEEPEA